jgi:4-hydroxy-tetrahydrodipicolinate synthase
VRPLVIINVFYNGLAGAGAISVIGQGFPKEFSDMIRLGLNRKVDEAFRKQYLLSDF